MSTRREILTGIFAALISVVILGGSFMIATTETESTVAMAVSKTPTLTSSPTRVILVTQRPGEPTYTPSPTPPPTQTPTREQSVSCTVPPGWSSIMVQPGDTLDSLAQLYNTTPEELAAANCLVSNNLIPGSIIYIPGPPPPTHAPCGPPNGWVYYIVQSGDTLYRISQAFGTTVAQLQKANCMGSSIDIRAGQKLYVPNVPTAIKSSTPAPSVTPSPEPSATPTDVPPSATPTYTPPSPVPTTALPSVTPDVPTETPTETPASPTETPTETLSATVTSTETSTATSTPTDTPEPPTATPTEWFTPTIPPTITPLPTETQTPTDTFTPVPTSTDTPVPPTP